VIVSFISIFIWHLSEESIAQVLTKNVDLFAWSTSDMLGIDPKFNFHRLVICPEARPVTQRKRKLDSARRKVVDKEAKKLLSVGFIKEVQYTTWLANMVMVKNSKGRWMMHTNYTDLNKVFPKESYPISSIYYLWSI